MIELAGKKFNEFTVLEFGFIKNGHTYWKCQCSCGNIRFIDAYRLTHNGSKSCGCLGKPNKRSNLVGQRFGKLVVESFAYSKDNRSWWNCNCDCGGSRVVLGKHLKTGQVKSCGCLKHTKLAICGQTRIEEGRVINGYRFTGNYEYTNNKLLYEVECLACGKVSYKKLYNVQHFKCMCIKPDTIYPQWFIDELVHDLDKERAKSGKLRCDNFVDFYCPKHGPYNQVIYSHIKIGTGERKEGCSKCTHRVSSTEESIGNYVNSLSEHNFSKDSSILDGKEIDLLSLTCGLGIEYNGSAYHATINGVFSDKPKLYHRDKFLMAKSKGIHLINIFDVDWETNKEKIMMYLRYLILGAENRLYARKCDIKAVDKAIANDFYDKYHLQGGTQYATINYGLYYNDELVSVMSFGNCRLKKHIERHYELHRYCVKDNYSICGGAERLLKHFVTEYSPKSIISFSDNDYFSGDIYIKLGFNCVGQSTPRYYWFYGGIEYKREQCRLSKLKNKFPDLFQEAIGVKAKNKENYIMSKLGAKQVWRSGITKWEKLFVLE